MSEQNKDNISQFFRKAVQKPKISFEEGDWEKLEAKLDAASRVAASKPNHWRTAFIAAVALLFISTSLLLYTSYQVKTLSAKAKTDKSNLNSTVESVPKKSESEKHTAEKKETKDQETKATEKAANLSLLSTDITGQEIRASVESNSSEARDQHLTSSQVSEPSNTTLSRNNNVSNKTLAKNSDITNKKVETSAKSITSETRDQNIASSQVSGSNNKPFQNDAVIDKALFADAAVNNDKKVTTATQSPDGEAINQSTDDTDSTSSKKEKEPIVKSKRSETELTDSLVETVKSKPSRWSVMLSLSPDFSSTDLGKFSTPGSAFGIAAYYAVNNRLSVSAGVVKSNKFYWDNGDEYKPNQTGYWAKKTNGIVPTVIEGSCSVLEIPVGLQYYFVSARKNKLYLASTLSSYIMLKEAYQYTFDAPNPGAAESWNAKKTSYFLFSIANLSVGYERSISNRLMIGVSPYLKIPMSGVGSWANIKLYSTGASFTLRYQFQKKKKPDRLIPAD